MKFYDSPSGVIYALHDGNHEYRYVGQTRGQAYQRVSAHVNTAPTSSTALSEWIMSVGEHLEYEILEDNLRADMWRMGREAAWTRAFFRQGYPLFNRTNKAPRESFEYQLDTFSPMEGRGLVKMFGERPVIHYCPEMFARKAESILVYKYPGLDFRFSAVDSCRGYTVTVHRNDAWDSYPATLEKESN